MKDIDQRKAELRKLINLNVSGIYDLRAYGNKECAERALGIIDEQDTENQSLKEEVERLKEKLEKAIFLPDNCYSNFEKNTKEFIEAVTQTSQLINSRINQLKESNDR